MAHHKHWAVSTDDPTAGRKFRLACGMPAWINSAKDSGPPWSLCGASVYRDMAACDPDWYCSDCAKAARLALAAESAPKPSSRCTSEGCGSHAINPGQSGRDDASDLDLCDVCYWRKRAQPEPRPISDAPTDGTFVLAHWSVHEYPRLRGLRWAIVRTGTGLVWCTESGEPLSKPTHFLPLPPEVL